MAVVLYTEIFLFFREDYLILPSAFTDKIICSASVKEAQAWDIGLQGFYAIQACMSSDLL